ncbi:MAG: RHS repeat-associated core domain-containing protein [Phycisphaerae bacterium]|nr:RHS repeat-associated core domain-containing protein [Phycisphaerae bacterium]
MSSCSIHAMAWADPNDAVAFDRATDPNNPQTGDAYGDYFYRQFLADNSANAFFDSIETLVNGQPAGGQDAYLAATPEEFTYDEDGNLIEDGRWSYRYDGENRLVAMEASDPNTAVGPALRLAFSYDYQGRRTAKVVYGWSGSAWTLAATTRFAWDGWLMAAELGPDNSPTRTYAWGLDLSGSREGAGGIGGLAFARTWQGPTAWTVAVPAFDGNGNLVELLDVTDGDPNAVASVAGYQYDPYGNLLTSAGEAAEAFPLRFSSKYTDAETGLAYFGYRYYNSGMGRWINRDPIEEEGGINIYCFVANSPPNLCDPDGRVAPLVILGIKVFFTGSAVNNGILAMCYGYYCTRCLLDMQNIADGAARAWPDDPPRVQRWVWDAMGNCVPLCSAAGKRTIQAAFWVGGRLVILRGIIRTQ